MGALDLSILDNNLNNAVSYQDLFHALGYGQEDTLYFRTFYDPERDGSGNNSQAPFGSLSAIVHALKSRNEKDNGVFYIVNGGGQDDKAVLKEGIARAQFIDFDDYPFDEQVKRLNEELESRGYIVIRGKTSRAYFLVKIYGAKGNDSKESI